MNKQIDKLLYIYYYLYVKLILWYERILYIKISKFLKSLTTIYLIFFLFDILSVSFEFFCLDNLLDFILRLLFLSQFLKLPHLLILTIFCSFPSLNDWQPWMDLNDILNTGKYSYHHHSVVDKVEDDLQDAAEDGGQGEPQVDLIGSGMGLVFLLFCPNKSVQELVSWVDLTH